MPTEPLSLIESIRDTRMKLQLDPDRLARLQQLQQWQVGRLRRTYEDCSHTPRYGAALEFFMTDLYGPHDFGRRDRDLSKVLHTWQRVLPERALGAITAALELEELSQTLDLTMLDALGDAPLSEGTYAKAYRQANRRKDRQRQIWLIVSAGRSLDALIRNPWLGKALKLARTPARLAGVTALHEFLERGYSAFSQMNGAEELLRMIEQRETTIMQKLFAGAPDPFDLDGKQESIEAG